MRRGSWLQKVWSTNDAFTEHRLRTVLTAVVTAVTAAFLLAVGPAPDSRLGIAWVSALAAVLSIAIVTLLYELFLRESHAVALRRFIQLNSAVMRSGLRTIDEEVDVEWRQLFELSRSITFVLVSPYRASQYLNEILRTARGRTVRIRFCFPDLPEGEQEDEGRSPRDHLVQAIGADQRLGSSITSTVGDLVSTFDRESRLLGPDSVLEVAVYRGPVYMEGVLLDRATVLMPFECDGRPRGSQPVCLVFGEGRSTEIRRYRSALEAVAQSATEIENKPVRTQ